MADVLPLGEAIAELVRDGDTVALEGFTHLIPFAAGHEIIRQGRRDLTLVRMTPDLDLRPADRHGLRAQAGLLLGRQPRRRLAAPLPRRGRARLAAAARARGALARGHGRGLRGRRRRTCRSAMLRGYARHRSRRRTRASRWSTARSPASELAAVPALRPDVGIVHAQQADRARQRAALGDQRRAEGDGAARAARSLVTVEEVVDELEPRPGAVVLPGWAVDRRRRWSRAARTPRTRTATTSATTRSTVRWDAISRDRERFGEWMRARAGRDVASTARCRAVALT